MQKKKETKNRKKTIENFRNIENSKFSIKKLLFFIVIVLIIIFIVLFLYEFGAMDYFSSLNKKPQFFNLRDECSLYIGSIIHKIKNEGDCKIMCDNECTLRDIKFYKINFVNSTEDCNTCSCYCK